MVKITPYQHFPRKPSFPFLTPNVTRKCYKKTKTKPLHTKKIFKRREIIRYSIYIYKKASVNQKIIFYKIKSYDIMNVLMNVLKKRKEKKRKR